MNKFEKLCGLGIYAFVLAFSSETFALELKLNCAIKSKYTFGTGRSETSTGTALVEISDYGNVKYFFTTSAIDEVDNFTVTTSQKNPPGWTRTVEDGSNAGKWEILNSLISTSDNTTIDKKIVIDRNNGNIYITYARSSPTGTSSYYVNGTCEKIDETKKKF